MKALRAKSKLEILYKPSSFFNQPAQVNSFPDPAMKVARRFVRIESLFPAIGLLLGADGGKQALSGLPYRLTKTAGLGLGQGISRYFQYIDSYPRPDYS